jgi:hypothetical protein
MGSRPAISLSLHPDDPDSAHFDLVPSGTQSFKAPEH